MLLIKNIKIREYFPDHQQELTDLFSDIDKLHKLDDDHDGILLDTKDYSLELYFNTIAVHQKYKYDIFRISVNDMNGIEYKHKKFQEMVGYHTDHDPNIYRKFDASKDWRSFYHDTELSNIQIRDLNKEYINTFYYDDIKWINYK